MAIKRSDVKSCCGGTGAIILYTGAPIKKQYTEIFKNAGFVVPTHYENNGIFYVRKDTLTATASFGVSKVHVKVGNYRKEEQIAEFISLLEQVLGT